MAYGASAERGDALDAEQSVPLSAGGTVSSELQERDDSWDTEFKKLDAAIESGDLKAISAVVQERALMMKVKAAFESGDCNLLFAVDVNGDTFLHGAAKSGLVDSVQQLIKAGGKKLLFATNKYELSALHYASRYNRVEVVRLLIEAGGKKLLLMRDGNGFSALHLLLARAMWSVSGSSLRREEWS